MKVFLTGGTGYLGRHVLDALLREGHQVRALARSDASAEKLRSKEVAPVKGDLESFEVIVQEAAAAEAVIHTAFKQDFENWEGARQLDEALIHRVIAALKGTDKIFLGTSGGGVLGNTPGAVDESYPPPAGYQLADRAKNEQAMVAGAQHGVRAACMRLPLYVYDKDGNVFSQAQESKAKERGHATYFDDGSYAASTVHILDAAQAFVLALKHAKAGSIYHAASDSATGKEIAEAIAAKHGLPVKCVPSSQATDLYGPTLALFFTMTNLNNSEKAKQELGWKPTRHTFLECLAGTGS